MAAGERWMVDCDSMVKTCKINFTYNYPDIYYSLKRQTDGGEGCSEAESQKRTDYVSNLLSIFYHCMDK